MNDRKFALMGAVVFFARTAQHIATLAYIRRRYPKSSSAIAGAAGMFLALATLGSYPPSTAVQGLSSSFERAVGTPLLGPGAEEAPSDVEFAATVAALLTAPVPGSSVPTIDCQ